MGTCARGSNAVAETRKCCACRSDGVAPATPSALRTIAVNEERDALAGKSDSTYGRGIAFARSLSVNGYTVLSAERQRRATSRALRSPRVSATRTSDTATASELSSVRQSLTRTAAELAQLTSAHHELELKLRERTSRLDGAEQEVALLKRENASLRDEGSKLSAEKHKLEKGLAARDIELAAATQAAKDKAELLAKMTSLHEAATEAKRQLEDSLGVFKDNNSKLQEKLGISSAEINKGNAIIARLQGERVLASDDEREEADR